MTWGSRRSPGSMRNPMTFQRLDASLSSCPALYDLTGSTVYTAVCKNRPGGRQTVPESSCLWYNHDVAKVGEEDDK